MRLHESIHIYASKCICEILSRAAGFVEEKQEEYNFHFLSGKSPTMSLYTPDSAGL